MISALRRRFFSVTGSQMSSLISTETLSNSLLNSQYSILDCSWYLPNAGRNGLAEYNQRRIPGARFFDINGPGLSDKATNLPHMLPSEIEFASAAAQLGLSKSKHIVCYDTSGIFSAARVWYHLKAFGHKNVYVLDGGFPRWIEEGRTIESGAESLPLDRIAVEQWHLDKEMVRSLSQITENISVRKQTRERNADDLRNQEIIIDARSSGRFAGLDAEVRPGVRSGHIPFSLNVPFTLVLDSAKKNQSLLPKEDLQDVFKDAGVDLKRPGKIITSCGSGVTAAVITLALSEAGRPFESTALYDGSWTEYGSNTDTEVATGSVAKIDKET